MIFGRVMVIELPLKKLYQNGILETQTTKYEKHYHTTTGRNTLPVNP